MFNETCCHKYCGKKDSSLIINWRNQFFRIESRHQIYCIAEQLYNIITVIIILYEVDGVDEMRLPEEEPDKQNK